MSFLIATPDVVSAAATVNQPSSGSPGTNGGHGAGGQQGQQG